MVCPEMTLERTFGLRYNGDRSPDGGKRKRVKSEKE
jgi:hypothetical protein